MSAAAPAALRGLPGPLPEGENLLWQGAPDWWSVAVHAFHVRKLAAYFAALLAWLVGSAVWNATPLASLAVSAALAAALAGAALGLLALLGWLTSRTTVYTLTDRRIVMRFGIALPMSLNIPFRIVETAAFKAYADGTGDIPLSIKNEGRTAYLMLWPHARPWRMSRPEPTLRSVPDAARVAAILSRALATAAGQPMPRPVGAPVRDAERATPALRPTAGATAVG